MAERIRRDGSVSVAQLEVELGVSAMTVRRDLEALEREGRARRTHGGAVLPGYAGHEDSFHRRLEVNVDEKQRLATAATAHLASGKTVFIDSSTTGYYTAKAILAQDLRVTLLTNLIPIMELFAANEVHNTALIALGGSLRKLSLSVVGPQTARMISGYFADAAFVSVKGLTPDGYLTDPDPLEAEVKRSMIEHAREPVLDHRGQQVPATGIERYHAHFQHRIGDHLGRPRGRDRSPVSSWRKGRDGLTWVMPTSTNDSTTRRS